MKPDDLLKDYNAKRDFAKTQEPAGRVGQAGICGGRFVVQKHDATRLHYDFRLELDGVLKSWAVTKGPSANPADKRLAVRVEDHPLDYGDFEGTIPEGEYGGGTVMLWDEGTWEPVGDPHEGLAGGDLKFTLKGKRLKGEWVLVHMKGRDQKTRSGPRENWLLIKHRDRHASETKDLTKTFTTSVETGRDLDGIAKGLKSRRKSKATKTTQATKQPAAEAQVWTGGKAVALPQFRPPQLATLVDEVPAGRQWLFEMKYDGYRCLAAIAGPEVQLYTRNGNDWTSQFHRLVEPLSTLTKGSALIDGEICAFKDGRTDFSTLKDALSTGGPLVYFAFDLLELDGQSLEKLPLIERKRKLRGLLGEIEADAEVQYSEHVEGNGEKVFAATCEAGHEGVIAKLASSPYERDRNRNWLKIKCLNRQEFVIAGWRPSGKKKTFASLLLGSWESGKLIYRGRVGTGFNQDSAVEIQGELDRLAVKQSAFDTVPRDVRREARWIRPELVGEIAYTEITPDGVLRHPSFIGLRHDKPARQVRRETPGSAKASAKPAGPAADLSDDTGIAVAKRLGVRLTHPERVVFPGQGVTKGNIVAYYAAVADAMLPHLVNRPLSLVRCPQGRSKHCFFQKHASGGFPDQLKQVPITEKDGGSEDYIYVEDLAGVIAGVQMNSLEFHIWASRIDRLEKPDRIIFDIDPDEGLGFSDVRQAALDIRDRLSSIGLTTFPMVTGGKGIHVIAPLTARTEWPEVKAFCRAFAESLASEEPDRFTANIRKANRKGRMFIDYLRNERGSTAIAPYSTRSREGAPCAVPVGWDEVTELDRANGFSLSEAAARAAGPDPWPDYFSIRQSITKKILASVGIS